jgi:hypothetical protein
MHAYHVPGQGHLGYLDGSVKVTPIPLLCWPLAELGPLSLKDLIRFLISDNSIVFSKVLEMVIFQRQLWGDNNCLAWQRPISEIGTDLGKCATIIAPQDGML